MPEGGFRQWVRGSLLIGALVIGAVACDGPSHTVVAQDNSIEDRSFVIGRERRLTVDSYVNTIAWSPDSRYLAASDQRGHHVYVWDAATGSTVFKVPNSAGNLGGLAYTKDGQFLLGSLSERHAAFTVWNARTGERLQDVPGPDPKQVIVGSNNAQLIAVSPTGQYVAVVYGGSTAYGVYETSSWRLISVVQHERDQILTATFNPTGNRIALGGYSGNIYLFRFPEGDKLQTFRGDPNKWAHIYSLAFSPDGRVIATGSAVNDGVDDQQLRLWTADTYKAIRSYTTGFKQNIHGLSYSSDGRYIATVSYASNVRVWDANSTQLVKEISTASFFSSHIAAVVAFSPDGRKLAYGGEGGILIADVTVQN